MVAPIGRTHVVANLEKTVKFYQEVADLDVISPAAPLKDSLLLQQVRTVSKKAKGRAATLRMPGSEMTFTVVQFSGVEQKHITQRLYDPGLARFSMAVRDEDKAFANAVAHGAKVHSLGGKPVYTQQPRNNTKAVMLEDPDGFIFEFTQGDPVPQVDVPASKNVINVRVSPVVEDMDKSLAFYRDILGMKMRATNEVIAAVRALEGTPDAVVRTTLADPPGTNNFWVIWEFTKIERKRLNARAQDTGATMVSVRVENLAELLKTMKAAGVTVELASANGALVRSPDGLLVELLEKAR